MGKRTGAVFFIGARLPWPGKTAGTPGRGLIPRRHSARGAYPVLPTRRRFGTRPLPSWDATRSLCSKGGRMRDFAIHLSHKAGEMARIAHALARAGVNL